MAVTAANSGSQALTVTTEHFVDDLNVAGVYTFEVDLNAMVDGDVIELRVSQMILTAGTVREWMFKPFYGAQPTHDKIAVSEPFSVDLTDATAARCSIKQTFGTSRTVPWKTKIHN